MSKAPLQERAAGRRYRRWAGNPKGDPEDQTRCVENVHDDYGVLFHQCRRKRGHGPFGEYCKQHAPRAAARFADDTEGR